MDSEIIAKSRPLDDSQAEADPRQVMVPPDGYQLLHSAGRGSFSEIWKARDRSGRLYALKQLKPVWREDVTARHLLENEARIAAATDSKHVVRLDRSVSDADRLCLVLEWLDGQTLEARLSGGRPLPLGTAVWIGRQTAQGLNDLATAGFAHGDVKPANIFVTGGGDAKLIDLGFACPLKGDRIEVDRTVAAGTAEYMAPEILAGDRARPIARDIYSLGITLFRMISGRLPFQDATTAGVLKLQRQAKPPGLQSLRPEAPAKLCDLVAAMLAKQPVRRPCSYADIVRELIELELALLPQRVQAA